MPTQVIMPQLGESVVEGTVSKWLKREGEAVEEFEPLLEISTDKVETEIPAPAGGVVLQILVQEGITVERGTLLALIGKTEDQALTPSPSPSGRGEQNQKPNGERRAALENGLVVNDHAAAHVTPVVARMVAEYDLDLSQISGSGRGGRVTKKDVEAWLERNALGPNQRAAREPPLQSQKLVDSANGDVVVARHALPDNQTTVDLPPWEQPGTGDLFKPTVEYGSALTPDASPSGTGEKNGKLEESAGVQDDATGAKVTTRLHPVEAVPQVGEGELVPLTAMRRSIAEHMRRSVDTAPHVTTIFEVDLSSVLAHREANKDSFARQGINLTLTAYFAAGTIHALQTVPILNARWDMQGIFKPYAVNLGIAVSVDEGLIVPVIRRANELNLQGLARTINDLAVRARSKALKPDETQGGTFTISNHGVGGSIVATPIINQPQSGILGVGVLEKRVKVITDEHGADMIAIRPCCYVSLTFDHRVADGASADAFLLAMKRKLEDWT